MECLRKTHKKELKYYRIIFANEFDLLNYEKIDAKYSENRTKTATAIERTNM